MSQANEVPEAREPLVVTKKVSVEGLDAVIGHYVEQGYEVKAVVPAETVKIPSQGVEILKLVLVVFVKKDRVFNLDEAGMTEMFARRLAKNRESVEQLRDKNQVEVQK